MKTIYLQQSIPKILAVKALSKLTKQAYFAPFSPIVYRRDLPDPPLPAPDWVRVRNIQTGICGTDISFFKCKPGAGMALEPMPITGRTYLGHETVGIVEEAGDGVTGLAAGDRVTLMKYTSSCGLKGIDPPCRFCAEGSYCLCENYAELSPLGLPDVGAGFGDRYLAPENQLIKVPDGISDDDAIFIEPASVALHAVLRHPPKPGEKVLVLGTGTVGLCMIQCLKLIEPECRVYVPVRSESKKRLVLSLGADEALMGDGYEEAARVTGGRVYTGALGNRMLMGGYDAIYDGLGTRWAFQNCLRWLRARGTYVKVGYEMAPTKFDETPLWFQELTVIGVNSHGMEEYEGEKLPTFALAIRFIAEGRLKFDGFITHRFPLDEYKRAFRQLICRPKGTLKVVLTMPQP